MYPITFGQANRILRGNSEDVVDLPVYQDCNINSDGIAISCWQLSWLERIKILFYGKLWILTKTYLKPLQPISATVDNPFNQPNEQ